MGVHDGHRERLKARFAKNGIDNFQEHEILELLLMFAIPQGDTNPLAHRLINTFGNLSGVLDASQTSLLQIEGVGPHTASLLQLLPQIFRRYLISHSQDLILDSTEATGKFILPRFVSMNSEAVFLVCLDAKNKVLGTDLVHSGSINSAEISIRNIVQVALHHCAVAVVLAHNHPGGIATPSPQDLATTRKIQTSLDAVSIKVIDHLIVADNDFVSLADSGFFE